MFYIVGQSGDQYHIRTSYGPLHAQGLWSVAIQ